MLFPLWRRQTVCTRLVRQTCRKCEFLSMGLIFDSAFWSIKLERNSSLWPVCNSELTAGFTQNTSIINEPASLHDLVQTCWWCWEQWTNGISCLFVWGVFVWGMPRRYIPMYEPREASRFDTSAAIVDFSYTSGLMKQQQNYSHCTSTAPSPAVRGTESERSAVLTQCLYPQWVCCSRSWFWIPPVELEMLSWTFKALMSSLSERPLLICLHEWRK